MKTEDIIGLLAVSKIDNDQDIAMFRLFCNTIVKFQIMFGISDDKIIRFATVMIDFINMGTDEEKRKK